MRAFISMHHSSSRAVRTRSHILFRAPVPTTRAGLDPVLFKPNISIYSHSRLNPHQPRERTARAPNECVRWKSWETPLHLRVKARASSGHATHAYAPALRLDRIECIMQEAASRERHTRALGIERCGHICLCGSAAHRTQHNA